MISLADCHIITLPQIAAAAGAMTLGAAGTTIGFDIARVFYLYQVPGTAARGAHAHKTLEQFIICVTGCFSVILDDGRTRKTIKLDRADCGLYIPPFIWDEEVEFSAGGVCLVLASQPYNESDYIRDYDQFLAAKGLRAGASSGTTPPG